MLDFIFHRDEKNSKIVQAKLTGLANACMATQSASVYDEWEIRRLSTKLEVLKVREAMKEQDARV